VILQDPIMVFKESEPEEKSVTEEFSITASDGKQYHTKHYNLDAIIVVGCRVNSVQNEIRERFICLIYLISH